jgi:hypothetical protein
MEKRSARREDGSGMSMFDAPGSSIGQVQMSDYKGVASSHVSAILADTHGPLPREMLGAQRDDKTPLIAYLVTIGPSSADIISPRKTRLHVNFKRATLQIN